MSSTPDPASLATAPPLPGRPPHPAAGTEAALEGLSTDLMLVVDLDGTLLASDILYETFWSALGRDMLVPLHAAWALRGGRAALKRRLAATASLDVTRLPYDRAVIDLVTRWRERGGRAALVTASDAGLARAIGDHLGIFDEVHGSDGTLNLKGPAKADFLGARFGIGRFVYVGDSAADLAVWPQAARAVTVNAGGRLRRAAEAAAASVVHLETRRPTARDLLRMLAPQAWLIGLLVFVPMLLAAGMPEGAWAAALAGWLSFTAVAWGGQLVGDLLALDRDRRDPRRKGHPFASGAVPIARGTLLGPGLMAAGLALSLTLGPLFAGLMLTAAALLTLLPQRAGAEGRLADGARLAGLATVGLAAGSVVAGGGVPLWLPVLAALAFCLVPVIGRPGAATARLRLQTLAVTLLCALVLALPTVMNGAPYLYFDSAAYTWYPHHLAHAALRLLSGAPAPAPDSPPEIIAGRSIYYGVVLYAGSALSQGWAVVALQAGVTGWLVTLTFRTFLPEGWERAALLSAAGLAALTPAAFFAGLMMPDVWAGLMILAAALLLAAQDRLSHAERLSLWLVLAFSGLSHSSHLALLLASAALAAGALAVPRLRPHLAPAGLAALAAAIAISLLGQMAASAATRVLTGAPPQPLPHVTAHLTHLGPGTQLIRETCPDSGFALCTFADRLPVHWIQFLFDADPATGVFWPAAPEVRRALAEEQGRFVAEVIRTHPVETLGGLALDGLAQLVTLSIEDIPMRPERARFLADNFSPAMAAQTQASAMYRRPELRHLVTGLAYASLAGAVLAIGWLVRRRPTRPGAAAPLVPIKVPHPGARLAAFVVMVIAGLVLNGLICGALASPYGRFQARVIWLLPLIAALLGAIRLRDIPLPAFSRRRIS
ncbi:haloacid dehalogenase-like hydrolase [Cereibacter sphaeroides]|uniref:haloacid dehalogenase-like hydrolase n=1 Tax=Cereibacter sphaeroides TaxID=1063 RepID=UPI001F366654|nr:haloacid dehalogenase-like hydrolase [Cereibacter sphaeroides]MCE6968673.1 hypothetical protein [Cereibacter sphaeroides]